MGTRLHDDEPDTGPGVVRMLPDHQVPELAGLGLERLSNTGSGNTLYRLGSEFVVRLPRLFDAAGRLGVELSRLPRLAGLPVGIPKVVHAADPTETYPYRRGDVMQRTLDRLLSRR